MHVLSKKPNLLIFCSLISEAKEVVKRIPGAVLLTSDTKRKKES
jgi:DNA repair protein RadD